ncbi:hypothetical protein BB561_003463 [Smittium simulii]|uniref:Ras-GAP domain-containing protein n=1 Tax=Smittium simulii TaxID=133385 RepID=A0A2T9YL86_9FUNG|nr:hypothetical protein BB561_003463 [Smittium simulii]
MVRVRSPTDSTFTNSPNKNDSMPYIPKSRLTTDRISPYANDSPRSSLINLSTPPHFKIASLMSPAINNDFSHLYASRLSMVSIPGSEYSQGNILDSPLDNYSSPFSSMLKDIPDSPDVTGLKGRHKLMKSTSTVSQNPMFKRNGKWCDIERGLLNAYEYLCHVAEAKEWVEGMINRELAPIGEFEESLRDGITLAELAKSFCPQVVGRIVTISKPKHKSYSSLGVKRYLFTENINYFIKAIRAINLPKSFFFEVTDLYDAKNLPKVIYCIHATSHFLESIGLSRCVNNLVGVLEFTEEQLEQTQIKLNNLNASTPLKFNDINRRLSNGSNSKKAQISSQNTTPNSSASTLTGRSSSKINRSNDSINADDSVYSLYSFWTSNPDFVLNLQSYVRRYLALKEFNEKSNARIYKRIVDSTRRIQALIRIFLAKKVLEDLEFENMQFKLKQLELDAFRSKEIEDNQALLRQNFENQRVLEEQNRSEDQRILEEQARFEDQRALEEQNRFEEETNEFNRRIINLQALIRGYLARKLQSDMKIWVKSIKNIQACCRGVLVRLEYTEKLQNWHDVQVKVSKVQALCRGYLVRKQKTHKMDLYKKNINVIVKIQNLFRAKLAGAAYRTLTVENSVPTPIAVRNCAPILDDTDQDLAEELELERLRQLTARKIRDSQHTEQLLKDLDIKIALLVRNKISIDDIVKQTSVHMKFFKELRNPSIINTSRAISTYFAEAQYSESLSALNNLNRNSRQRLDNYQHLFHLLQSQPIYLARLIFYQHNNRSKSQLIDGSKPKISLSIDQANSTFIKDNSDNSSKNELSDSTIMAIFGNAQNLREEYLFLKLLSTTLDLEINSLANIEDFNVFDSAFVSASRTYINSPKNQDYISNIMKTHVLQVINMENLDLECDSLILYKSLIRQEELKTGIKSQKSYDISRDETLNDPETRQTFVNNLRDLRTLSENFLDSILASLELMPYGVRFLCRQFKLLLEEKFPGKSEDQYLKIVGNVLFYQYFSNYITAPHLYGLYDKDLTSLQKKNLLAISKILGQIASGVQFSDNDVYLQPLNNYVSFSSAKFSEYIFSLVNVNDLDVTFQNDEYTDLVSLHKPTLYLSVDDILKVHISLTNNLKVIAPELSLNSKEIAAGNEALKNWLRKSARKSALRKYTSAYFSESDAALPVKSIASIGTFRNDFDRILDFLPSGTVLVEKIEGKNAANRVLAFDDPLLVIMREIGSPPRLSRDPYARSMITLNLSDRFAEDSIAFMASSNSNNQSKILSNSSKLFNNSFVNTDPKNLLSMESERASALYTLFLKTKRNWLAILRVQSGDNLLDILNRPTTPNDEERWEFVVNDELNKLDRRKSHLEKNWRSQKQANQMLQSNMNLNNSKANALKVNTFDKMEPIPGEDIIKEWSHLTFAQLKTKVRIAMQTLEKSRWVDRPRRSAIGKSLKRSRRITKEHDYKIRASNNYQGMLNAIVRDLKTKSARREQRRIELRRIREAYISLNTKTEYINSKRTYYEQYLDSCIQRTIKPKPSSTNNTIVSKLKAKLPGIMNIFGKNSNNSNLNSKNKFGSFKYNAEKLYLKGVLQSVEKVSSRQLDKINFVFSSDEHGVIKVNINSSSGLVSDNSCELRLEDLLQMQYHNTNFILLFNDLVKMNISSLIYFINKKFFA